MTKMPSVSEMIGGNKYNRTSAITNDGNFYANHVNDNDNQVP